MQCFGDYDAPFYFHNALMELYSLYEFLLRIDTCYSVYLHIHDSKLYAIGLKANLEQVM